MGIKILFLDIDGVLNNCYTKDSCGVYIGIDDKYVQNLRKIVDSADNCKIVLSSTWRLGLTRDKKRLKGHWEYLSNKLAKQGLKIFDVTPDFKGSRGREIHQWLEDHKDLNIENWIVLDDEYFYDFSTYGIREHLVETYYYSSKGALNDEKTEEAIKLLNGDRKERWVYQHEYDMLTTEEKMNGTYYYILDGVDGGIYET